MSNTVTLTFKIAQDGSLKAIGQEAEKTAKSTDKATKASGNYNKGQKGVAQAGMNGTKAFSKMRNEIGGGGSGLVGAYAGLAANVFALTAAFGALSRASRANQLEEGLIALGQASGLAMKTLSTGLVEATGHAVSLEEAMRSTAMITSAGIDAGSIEKFGKVARGAATALGRDVNDAISRLTRGITKLEPELLDELGIMVRLDEASKTYADSIGKSVSDLTRYEKSQAFLNATLEEGERKFGALAEVDVNVFDKLSASLANLLKGGLGGLSSIIEPIVGYLASSPMALVGVLAAFASTIAGAVVGSLSEMAETAANATTATISMSAASIKSSAGLNTTSNTLKNYVTTLEEGGDVMGAYTKAVDGQAKSMRYHNGVNKEGGYTLEEFNLKKKNAKTITNQLGIATQQHALAQTQDSAATAQLAFAQGNLVAGLQGTWATLKGVGTTMKVSILTTTSFKTALSGLAISAKAAGAALKTMGAGVMAMLGPIGIAVTVLMMLYDAVMFVINEFKSDETKRFEEATKALSEAQKELTVNLKEVDDAFAGTSNKIHSTLATYVALNNVLSTFTAKYAELKKAATATGAFDKLVNAQMELINSSEYLTSKFKEQGMAAKLATEKGDFKAQAALLEELTGESVGVARAMDALSQASKGAKDGVTDFLNAGLVKTDVDQVLTGLSDLRGSLFRTIEKGEDAGKLEINPKMTVDGNFSKVLNDALSGDMALTYGLSEQKRDLAEKEAERTTLLKAQVAAQEEVTKAGINFLGGTRLLTQAEEERLKKAEDVLTAAEEAFKKTDKNYKEEAEAIANAMKLEEERLAKVQTRIITEKQTLASQKAILAIAKETSANTESSLHFRQMAEDNYLQTQITAKSAAIEDKGIAIERARIEVEAGEATEEQKKQLKKDEADILQLILERALLESKVKSDLEKQLESKDMLLKKLKESQKADRAVLDISKKVVAAAKEQLDIQQRMSQLQQKMQNRKTGADDTESQRLAIELDDEVVAKKIAFIAREAKLKKDQVNLEKTLLVAKMNHLKAEIDVINEKRGTNDQIDTTALVGTINDLKATGGLFEIQIQNITDNATLLTQELLYQKASTNIIAIQATERLKNEQAVRDVAREESEIRGSMLAGAIKMAEVSNKMAQNSNTNLFGDPKSNTVAAKLAKEANQLKVVAAKAEYDQKIIMHNLDMEVLYAKFELLKAEAEADGRITKQEAAMLNAHQKVLNAKVAASKQEVKAAGQAVNLAKSEAAIANKQALGAASGEGFLAVMQTLSGQKAAEDQKLADKKKAEDKETFKAGVLEGFDQSSIANRQVELLKIIADALTGTDNAVDIITNGTDAKVSKQDENNKNNTSGDGIASTLGLTGSAEDSQITEGTEKPPVLEKVEDIDKLQASLKGAATSMRALGPDGEGPAAMFDGLNTMSTAFEKGKSEGEMMSSALAGIGQVMAGASQMKVNAIDKEIAAEQKRDGKSKASMAKIAALEKKKDAIKKKQFEMNKKISMAQVVIATATGVMETMKEGGFFASPLAMAVAAMGAAQLAIIAGTSYQSAGGGGGGSQSPQKVSMGSRENTVDLAKGNSASGEMAYMRGEGGVGKGATNFKPTSAFSGYKNRNAGGYVVGEQGPELFMPETPGEIIPAGRLGGAEPTNVNFNISAVDAQGVEDVLVRQKGHIIRMIREAANEHGQPFLEDISDGSYTS